METNLPSKTSRRGVLISSPQEEEHDITTTQNYENDVSMFSDMKCCYYLLEAMPLPGPTWSTTEPSVLAEPQTPTIESSVGSLEWEENEASSYTWWMRFLESLDSNMVATKNKLELSFVENDVVMEHSKGLSHESKFVDAIDLGCCSEDWLLIPPMERDLEDMVVP